MRRVIDPCERAELLERMIRALGVGGDALDLLARVAPRKAQQLRPLAALRYAERDLVPRLLREKRPERFALLRQHRQQDLHRDGAAAEVVLAQHRREDGRLVLLTLSGEDVDLAAEEIAVLDVQHAPPAAHRAGVHAPHVRVGADARDDLLRLAEDGDGADAVAQGGRAFELQRFGGLLHLRLQLRRQLAVVTAEDALGLSDAGLILRAARPVRQTEPVAPADVVVQARALAPDVARKLARAGRELQRRPPNGPKYFAPSSAVRPTSEKRG